MSGAKGFLIVFAAVYVVLASGGLKLWGPPGYSAEYMDAHQDGHEQYLAITKSTAYKQYMQQGDAVAPDPEMAEQAAFVAEYTATPEFKAETRRRTIYEYYFGFLNAGGLMLIAYRFGRAPITELLDAQIAEVRGRLDRAANQRLEAVKRLEAAQERIDAFQSDEQEAKAQAAELMSREQIEIEKATANALSFIDQETEDRKRIVDEQAVKTMRQELVQRAAAAAAEAYQSHRSAETEAAEIDAFITILSSRTPQHAAREGVPK